MEDHRESTPCGVQLCQRNLTLWKMEVRRALNTVKQGHWENNLDFLERFIGLLEDDHVATHLIVDDEVEANIGPVFNLGNLDARVTWDFFEALNDSRHAEFKGYIRNQLRIEK